MSQTSLERKILKLSKQVQGTIGLAVKHVQSKQCLFLNDDQLFPTASVFKVPVLVELFNQVKIGKVSLDQRLKMREKISRLAPAS